MLFAAKSPLNLAGPGGMEERSSLDKAGADRKHTGHFAADEA